MSMNTFLYVNRYLAQQAYMQNQPAVHPDNFVIRIMRGALETSEAPELFMPAAVEWISILGSEMYSWTRMVSYERLFDSQRVWRGHDRFYHERWNLWKQRFIELSLPSSGLPLELRGWAVKGLVRMNEIEWRALNLQSDDTSGKAMHESVT